MLSFVKCCYVFDLLIQAVPLCIPRLCPVVCVIHIKGLLIVVSQCLEELRIGISQYILGWILCLSCALRSRTVESIQRSNSSKQT